MFFLLVLFLILSPVSELWLLMKGLASQKAKDFMDKFERDHACFIEMLKEGEVALPPISFQRYIHNAIL